MKRAVNTARKVDIAANTSQFILQFWLMFPNREN